MTNDSTDLGALDELARKVQADADRDALDQLLKLVRPGLYRLALRFIWHPEDAEDATQEILIRLLTNIGSFRGESAFRTWAYRVAVNALLTTRKRRMEQRNWTFRDFSKDLANGLAADPIDDIDGPADSLLLEEVKIGCTLGMLLCLDRGHRIAFILGDILELDHIEAAEILEINRSTYRKRLSRARKQIVEFTIGHCGLVNPDNACRCNRRVHRAIELARVNPSKLNFAVDPAAARSFPEVLERIRSLEEIRRAAALYRSQRLPEGSARFTEALKEVLVSADLMD